MADRDELLSHEYDGIQEYDNDLPRWWVWLFVLCVVWGVWRVVYYHFGPGLFQEERLAIAMQELEAIKEANRPPEAEQLSEESLLALVSDPAAMQKAQETWTTYCMACHLQGQGLVGPNLTDDFWLHGGSIIDIYEVIENGVVEKGMIAWKDKLSADDIAKMAAYVWNLHGKEFPNPKAPQGEKVVR